MVILYRDEMRPGALSAREMVGFRSLVWDDDETEWKMHNGCTRDAGTGQGGILLDTMMQAFLKMGNIPFPAGQFREPAFYVEVDGGNAANLRLYQNYRSHNHARIGRCKVSCGVPERETRRERGE